MAKKTKNIVTPKGVAVYPWLTRPDTKFKSEGEYRTKLRLPVDQAQPLMEQIDEAILASVKQAKEKNPAKAKKIKAADAPYSVLEDDDGNPTGEVEFSFKLKALVTPKDGEPFKQQPRLFDTKGKPVSATGLNIGSGSSLRISFSIVPFHTDLVGAGVSLRLYAAQILELVEGGGGTAESFGFESEEDGYEFQASTPKRTPSDGEEDEEDPAEDEEF